MVARRWTYRHRVGRTPSGRDIRQLILRVARENPRWGYLRTVGELKGLGVAVSATTVKRILREAGLGPAGTRQGPSWPDFLRTHANSILAGDFFAVDTVWLQRLYVLFFIELGSRRVDVAGCAAHPDAAWVTQQARHLAWACSDRTEPIRFAERFVRTVRSECVDWLLIANAEHLVRTLTVFVDHYNGFRPHRSLGLMPPNGRTPSDDWTRADWVSVTRRDRHGGLLHEYERAA